VKKPASTEGTTMPALQFDFKIGKLAKSKWRGRKDPRGYWKPGGAITLRQVPRPTLVADDWLILKTALCGICGSDEKEITLGGAADNPLPSFITFPHTIGHEVVGTVDQVGPAVTTVTPGDRVAVYPVLSCKPRGISPECPRCQQGDYNHCQNFKRGNLPVGMTLGTAGPFGGYAPFVAIHESQAFRIPDGVSFEQAVLADPFAVAFHACLLLDPQPDQTILIFGLGTIGLATVLLLRHVFGVKHILGVDRYQFPMEKALEYGAKKVFTSSGNQLIEEIGAYLGIKLVKPFYGPKWGMDGVDGIIDCVGAGATFEVGLRVSHTKTRIVFLGVSKPVRFEWTPWYFKEISIHGSNGAGLETLEGKTQNAFQFYLDFLAAGRIDPAEMLTHTFPLVEYAKAFEVVTSKAKSNAIKVAFDFTQDSMLT